MPASPSASAAVGTMVAPASAKAASVRRAPAPAPLSIVTAKPRAFNFLTESGETATRRSPGSRSLITPIRMMRCPLAKRRHNARSHPACQAPDGIGMLGPWRT